MSGCRPLLMAALLLPSLLSPLWAAQEWQQNRLTPLTRITVGPWDNLLPAVAADGSALYYTHTRNQIPTIQRQTQHDQVAVTVLPSSGDTTAAALSPDGSRLALISYADDAQGDLCVVLLTPVLEQGGTVGDEAAIDCISGGNNRAERTPFWLTNSRLGYLSRAPDAGGWDLQLFDTLTRQTTTLLRGEIFSPTASADGRYILYNTLDTRRSQRLMLYDQQQGEVLTLPTFDLPGRSGTYAFSRDGAYLYFSRYLSDTNHDQQIDGSDHSVAFRIPFQTLLDAAGPLLAEQLTSVADNCNFPATSSTHLYLTCAREGSLDIYRLPLTGMVPPSWGQPELQEAYTIARTYEERLLLINSLRYRHPSEGRQLLERLMVLHLQIGEESAVGFYLQQLESIYGRNNQPRLSQLYRTLHRLIVLATERKRDPAAVVSARYRRLATQAQQQFEGEAGLWTSLEKLALATLDASLQQPLLAMERLASVDLSDSFYPLERFLIFELYRDLLTQTQQVERLLTLYPNMYNAAELQLESQIYYALHTLRLIESLYADTAARLQALAQLPQPNSPALQSLFRAEQAAILLGEVDDPKSRNQQFKELSTLLRENGSDPLLRKALHTRAIEILGRAEQFETMELLSRNWLLGTHISEMEFYNSAEQYSLITMDKGYGLLAQGQSLAAYSTFYSAIRQTNDLEAHHQFITLGLTQGLNKEDNLAQSYQLLQQQGLLQDRQSYVAALQTLIRGQGGPQEQRASLLQAVIKQLQPLPQSGLGSAIPQLLLGYLYHEQLLLSQRGYQYDRALFQQAHHHYMLALDLGQDNQRISAAVWENLGWLHFDVRNYALSSAFLLKRGRYPFTHPDRAAAYYWALARSRFYNNEPEAALQAAEQALQQASKGGKLPLLPFKERQAFYALQAGEYARAVEGYSALERESGISPSNRLNMDLAQGFALFKSGQSEAARQLLQQLIEQSQQVEAQPAGGGRLLAALPARQQLIAYGLLAQVGDTPAEQQHYRQQRLQLLESLKQQGASLAMEEGRRLSLITQDYHLLAVQYEAAGRYTEMGAAIRSALKSALEWVEEGGGDAGPVIYRTHINLLSLAISHPDQLGLSKPLSTLAPAITRTLEAMELLYQQSSSHPLLARIAKLKILWSVYLSGNKGGLFGPQLQVILERLQATQMQHQQPLLYAELDQMVTHLLQRFGS